MYVYIYIYAYIYIYICILVFARPYTQRSQQWAAGADRQYKQITL